MEDSLGALKEAQSAGKIRHIGLSEVSPEQIERARKIVPIVTVQNRYNITDRKRDNTLAYCEKEQIGFMPWAPVGGTRGMSSAALEKIAKDHSISIYQLGLAWLLHRSPVMLPIRDIIACAPGGKYGGAENTVEPQKSGRQLTRWRTA